MKIISPTQAHEWKAYFQLRFDVLREPWNQPAGSEVLGDEDQAIHAMAVEGNEALGVARMHASAPGQGQVRCVAVAKGQQGKGIGKAIMIYLEDIARKKAGTKFYWKPVKMLCPLSALGYEIQKESYLLFNEIQHYTMTKSLA